MGEDDRSGDPSTRPATESADGRAVPSTQGLPEHASAYYSPRPAPIATSHATLETEAVRLDPGIDPGLASTQRVNVDGLAPAWVGRPHSDAPTVLIPTVKARRRRRKIEVGIAAAVVGAVAGAALGLTGDPSRGTEIAPAGAGVAVATGTAAPRPPIAAHPVETPIAKRPVEMPIVPDVPEGAPSAPSAPPPVPVSVKDSAKVRGRATTRSTTRSTSAPSAWFKPAPPKAWLK